MDHCLPQSHRPDSHMLLGNNVYSCVLLVTKNALLHSLQLLWLLAAACISHGRHQLVYRHTLAALWAAVKQVCCQMKTDKNVIVSATNSMFAAGRHSCVGLSSWFVSHFIKFQYNWTRSWCCPCALWVTTVICTPSSQCPLTREYTLFFSNWRLPWYHLLGCIGYGCWLV